MFSNNYLQRGMYVTQLAHWMEYFALGEQLLVLRYEQFRDDPETVFFQLLDFVGAPRFVPADGFATRHNVKDDPNAATRKHPLTNATRTYLAALFDPTTNCSPINSGKNGGVSGTPKRETIIHWGTKLGVVGTAINCST